jgi:hypothetical protein
MARPVERGSSLARVFPARPVQLSVRPCVALDLSTILAYMPHRRFNLSQAAI